MWRKWCCKESGGPITNTNADFLLNLNACYRKLEQAHANANYHMNKLESSHSPHTSAKAMLFARWRHHIRLAGGFPYAPLKAMITKISKWSRIQDSFWITPKIESLVVSAIPDVPRKFKKNPSITFWVILLTHRQIDRQTKSGKNITSLAEVITVTKCK